MVLEGAAFGILALVMAVLARASGGGYGARHLDQFKLTWLPEFFFSYVFGAAVTLTYPDINIGMGWQFGSALVPNAEYHFDIRIPSWAIGAAAQIWSYLWMQTGHGTVLHWGDDPSQAIGRTQTLTGVVNFIARLLNIEIGSKGYCRLFMAVKGFCIGLPVGGLPLAILWPAGYEIGHARKNHAMSEHLSGLGAAIAITAWVLFVRWAVA